LLCINHNCYLYMPSWGPDLVNKLISISIYNSYRARPESESSWSTTVHSNQRLYSLCFLLFFFFYFSKNGPRSIYEWLTQIYEYYNNFISTSDPHIRVNGCKEPTITQGHRSPRCFPFLFLNLETAEIWAWKHRRCVESKICSLCTSACDGSRKYAVNHEIQATMTFFLLVSFESLPPSHTHFLVISISLPPHFSVHFKGIHTLVQISNKEMI
jgi:hypothetical protein